ncbi:hypothetical protein EKH55_5725 (plasmid) [Sinorhizobium alkalisoli]|nr:hypothetical protein EKH55_5725 [Sinorhizobium alkalisoli]
MKGQIVGKVNAGCRFRAAALEVGYSKNLEMLASPTAGEESQSFYRLLLGE